MCGIVGYTGTCEATPFLLHGLEKLVYRGYDSAGIAVGANGGIGIRKVAGPVEDLARSIAAAPLRGRAGLGHTRWATHGEPSEVNAHPHSDCDGKLALVHNGIIENADTLRRELEAAGHRFRTSTDTEVLVHLIEDAEGEDLASRVRSALAPVEGSYGIAVMSSAAPDTIVAVRRGSPVLVGIGEGEHFVASDISAVQSHADWVVHLLDGDIAVVTPEGYRILDQDGAIPLRPLVPVSWSSDTIDLGTFDTFMLKEIFEQPDAIRRTLGEGKIRGGGMVLESWGLPAERCREIQRIEILGCGTSWHAGIIGRYIMEETIGIPVQVEYASEYRYGSQIRVPGTLTVAISQSGETADTLEALRAAKKSGSFVLGIVNVVGSSIDRECDAVIHLEAGPEIGVASTKAFACQVVALNLLALAIGRARGTLSEEETELMVRELTRLPEVVHRALEVNDQIEGIARQFQDARGFLYMGRGVSFPVALEGALKLKEVSYIYAEGYPAAEMKHGPIALVDSDTPTVFVVPRDGLYRKVLSNIQEVKARGGRIIAICCEEAERELAGLAEHMVRVPCSLHPLFSPLSTVIPLQLLAYHVAVLRGCNVDRPRNLAKSVTVE